MRARTYQEIIDFLEKRDGSSNLVEISRLLSRLDLIGRGLDAEDVIIDEFVAVGLVTYRCQDPSAIVRLIPEAERLVRERLVIQRALRESPTRSISMGCAQRLLRKEKSPVDLGKLLFLSEEGPRLLGVMKYQQGDIIYLP